MSPAKKSKHKPALDKSEKNIEDTLDISKALSTPEKTREIFMLKVAEKQHLRKKKQGKPHQGV